MTIVSLAGIYKNSVTDLRDNSLYSRDIEENEIGREESSPTLVERRVVKDHILFDLDQRSRSS